MVIGADGVHSVVKDMMWDYADKSEPGTVPESDKSAMVSELCTFFGVSNMDDSFGLEPAESNIIYGPNSARLLFTHPGKVMWAITFKDDMAQQLEKRKATQEELEACAKRFVDVHFTEQVKLDYLWENRTRSGLLNIEEGIVDKWHAGRIVLVGDSVHKVCLQSRKRSPRQWFQCLLIYLDDN